jgi:hypothetical protein
MYYDPNQFGKKKRTIHFQDGHKKPGSSPYQESYNPPFAAPNPHEQSSYPSKPYTPNSGEYPPNKPTMQEEQQKKSSKRVSTPNKTPDSYQGKPMSPDYSKPQGKEYKPQGKEEPKKVRNEEINKNPGKPNPYSKPLTPKDNIGPSKDGMGKEGPNPNEGGSPAKKPIGPKGPKSPGVYPGKDAFSKYKQGLNKSKEPNQYSEKVK